MLHKWLAATDGTSSMVRVILLDTIPEVVPMSNNSALQLIVDEAVDWSDRNKLQLHPTKCKEFRIQFSKREYIAEPIIISGQQLEIVKSAKIMGVTLTDDLRCNKHIGTVVSKASKRLYLLKQLQRAGVDEHHLIDFYNACIRSDVEYACEVFHSSLPTYLSEELERVQRRAMRIIFPGMKCIYVKKLYNRDIFSHFTIDENIFVQSFSDKLNKILVIN